MATIFFGGGLFVFIVGSMSRHTVSDIQRIAERDRHHALHDALTGLPNRTLLLEHIEQAIAHAHRQLNRCTVILMDLDHFKEINDTLGHAVGDRLLHALAPRLQACVRESDSVSRLGGDEFAAVLEGIDLADAIKVAHKFARATEKPFILDGQTLSVGVSMGIALYPDLGMDAETLLKNADIAMYKAKRTATEYAVYDIESDNFTINRLELVALVREAVRNEAFQMVYQPKLDLVTGEVTSVEALIRCDHKDVGVIPPDVFIPIAEQIGLMRDLTVQIVRRALLQLKRWEEEGLVLDMSVNISARNLADLAFPSQIRRVLQELRVEPRKLILEITESSMMVDPLTAQRILNELGALGVGLAIDDFGTGYSSLAYLKHIPATEVKIDRSFIKDMLENENDAVIVSATIGMAHNLKVRVVAEGVENDEILQKIREWGCDTAQGYFIARPMLAEQLPGFVRRRFHQRATGGQGPAADARH